MFATVQFWIFFLATPLQEPKDYSTQKYNFAGCFVWVWNFVSDSKGRT